MSNILTTSNQPKRGFAAMAPEKRREIASLGGIAAHRCGHGHHVTSEEARAANRQRRETQNTKSQQPVVPVVPVVDSVSKE